MIIGAAAERPMILALALLDRKVVDAGDAQPHQAMRVELPILVTVAAEPVSAVVVRLVGEAHGDAVARERQDLFDQAIVELPVPLARQERLDGLAPLQELGAISPAAVEGIGGCSDGWIACVPGILRQANLLGGGLRRERRERGTVIIAWLFSQIALRPPRRCVLDVSQQEWDSISRTRRRRGLRGRNSPAGTKGPCRRARPH